MITYVGSKLTFAAEFPGMDIDEVRDAIWSTPEADNTGALYWAIADGVRRKDRFTTMDIYIIPFYNGGTHEGCLAYAEEFLSRVKGIRK